MYYYYLLNISKKLKEYSIIILVYSNKSYILTLLDIFAYYIVFIILFLFNIYNYYVTILASMLNNCQIRMALSFHAFLVIAPQLTLCTVNLNFSVYDIMHSSKIYEGVTFSVKFFIFLSAFKTNFILFMFVGCIIKYA